MRIAHLTITPAVGVASILVERWPMLGRIPEEQHRAGHDVALLCRSDRRARELWRGVELHTVPGVLRLSACLALVDEVAAFGAEVVHLHGITANTCLMASLLRARLPRLVIALQDQAFHWPPSFGGRVAVHLGLACADLVFFAVRSQADGLVASGALRPAQVVELAGGSTDFTAIAQAEARRRTGLRGDPLYLWVGRLVPVKDPLTAARGLAEALARQPKARLALVYGDAALHAEVRLGLVPHGKLPAIYASADVFVLASERESWCSALLEALACGASPVVSDIPANRAITGSVGCHFPVGDSRALLEALLTPPSPRRDARFRFHEHLTFGHLARQSLAAYQSVLERTERRSP